jgi:hypothetical protein
MQVVSPQLPSALVEQPPITWAHACDSFRQSYVTTEGQSASLSWCQAPIWGLGPDICYCQTVAGLFNGGAPSLTRGQVCRLQWLLVLTSAVILWSESRGTRDHILLSLIRDSLNLKAQILIIVSSRNRMVQLYLLALGSLFVANDSQWYEPASTRGLTLFGIELNSSFILGITGFLDFVCRLIFIYS